MSFSSEPPFHSSRTCIFTTHDKTSRTIPVRRHNSVRGSQFSKSGKPLSLKELILFTRTLSTTMKAGLPILRALTLAAHHLPTSSDPIIKSLLSSVENGTPLAESLRRYPDSFDHLFVSMVDIGERSGSLAESLGQLTHSLESKQALRTATATALLYPIIVCSITFLVTIVLLIYVVPVFRELFSEYGIALPFLTQTILSISDTLVTFWHVFVLGCTGVLFGVAITLRSPRRMLAIKGGIEHVPLLGTLLRTATIVRITKALGTMISVGIPASESLTICAESCAPLSLRGKLSGAAQSIAEGNPLAESLASTNAFPALMIEMIQIGEGSGTLDSALETTARWYEEEMNIQTKRLSQLVEPFLMLSLGIMIGGIVLAMYLPIFEMGNIISR